MPLDDSRSQKINKNINKQAMATSLATLTTTHPVDTQQRRHFSSSIAAVAVFHASFPINYCCRSRMITMQLLLMILLGTTTTTAFLTWTLPTRSPPSHLHVVRRHPSNQWNTERQCHNRCRHKTTASTTTSRRMIAPQQLGTFERLDYDTRRTGRSDRKVALLDFTSKGNAAGEEEEEEDYYIDFEEAWDFQKDLLNQHVERLKHAETDGGDDNPPSSFLSSNNFIMMDDNTGATTNVGCDTIIFLQHHPVYTLGTGSDEKFVLQQQQWQASTAAVPVVRMDRGGEVTYHGPGQLTVYPVLDLRSYRQDIHWYMRALEEAIILALSKCNLKYPAERQEDVTGVWVNNHKVAAVGIKCKKWITMHGLAVNVEEESLSNFNGIVPCGLDGRNVGCINQFLEDNTKPITVQDFAIRIKEALQEVFQIELVDME